MSGPRRVEPPVFYPTLEEMRSMSLEKYVESIEDDLEEYGIGRIVPPAGWTPRRRGYDDVDFRVEKAITQHATGRKGLFRTLLVEKKPLSVKHDFKPMAERPENQPSKAALEDPTHATIEREFWKKVAYDPPTYCADVAGTLFDAPTDSDDATRRAFRDDANDSGWPGSGSCSVTTPGWDVSRLDSLLSRTLKEKNITLDGVNSSYLYFGMWRALFAWHTEDCDLYSVNYLHYGAPKFWYAIAPEDRERFEILAQGMVPEMWRACPEFLRHKELLISPTLLEQNGIPFTRMMQKPGEFVVTYPGSYHSGFNCGYNCAESCNFATEAWVEIGEDAGVCECVPDAVSLDMRIFGDLCTRCHSDTDESDGESDSDASESEAASERDAGVKRQKRTDTTQKVTAKRKRARGGDATDSDDDEDSKTREAARRREAPRRARARGVDALGGDARRARRAPSRGPGAPQERGWRPGHVLHLTRRRGGQVQVRGGEVPRFEPPRLERQGSVVAARLLLRVAPGGRAARASVPGVARHAVPDGVRGRRAARKQKARGRREAERRQEEQSLEQNRRRRPAGERRPRRARRAPREQRVDESPRASTRRENQRGHAQIAK